jgi:hypothetical protein
MPIVSFEETVRAVVRDLQIEQGTDLNIPITITNLDVTGYSAKLQVREYLESSVVLFEMSTDNGKIDTTAGTVVLKFDSADFEGAAWSSGVYDLKITSPAPNSNPTRIMKGNFYIDPEVTR